MVFSEAVGDIVLLPVAARVDRPPPQGTMFLSCGKIKTSQTPNSGIGCLVDFPLNHTWAQPASAAVNVCFLSLFQRREYLRIRLMLRS